MPAAPQTPAILSDTDGHLFDGDPRMADSLGADQRHACWTRPAPPARSAVAEMEPATISMRARVAVWLAHGARSMECCTTPCGRAAHDPRMPAPAGSGFSEVAFAAIRSPACRRARSALRRPPVHRASAALMLDAYARLAAICLDSGGGFQRLVAAGARIARSRPGASSYSH